MTKRKSSKNIIKALKTIQGYTGGVSVGKKENWGNEKTGFKTIKSITWRQHQPCAPCKEGPPWESYTRRHFGLLHRKAFLILEIVQKRQPGKLASSWLWKSLRRKCAHFGNKTFLEMFNVAPLTIKKGNSHLTLLPLRCEWVQEASPFSSLTLHCRTGRENALE